jgi:hypothetical protein
MIALLEQIHAEFEARLNNVSLVAQVASSPSGDPSRFPALNLDDVKLTPDENQEPGVTYYEYRLSVEGNVKGGDGPSARGERNALYLSVVQAVMIDLDMGGLVESVEEGETRFGVAQLASSRHLSFVTEFIVRFPGNRGDPAI